MKKLIVMIMILITRNINMDIIWSRTNNKSKSIHK